MPSEELEVDDSDRRESVDAAGERIVGIDGTDRIVFATAAAARHLGYAPADLVGTSARELFAENGDGSTHDRVASLATDRPERATVDLELRRYGGDTVTMSATAQRADREEGELLVVGLHDTVDGRARAGADDAAAAYTVGMFHEVFDRLDDALLVTDPKRGMVKACNEAACDLLGDDSDTLLASSPADVFGNPAVCDELVASVRERATGWSDELVSRRSDGTVRPLEVSLAPIECDGERRLLWNLRDSTEQFERERTIRQQAAAMESAIDGMAIVDADGTYVYVNQAHAEMYGYDSPEEVIGEPWQRLYDEAAQERHEREVLPALDRQGYWRGQSVGRRPDGSSFEQALSLTRVTGGSVVGVVRDISDRKAAERQLQALNRTSHDLLLAENDQEIAECGVDAVERVIGFEISCIRLFDRESNGFDVVALTDEAERLMRVRRAFNMRSTHAARAYRHAETVVETEPVDADGPTEDTIRSSLHVPLGDYGVLSVLTTGEETVSERSVYLVGLLASDITMVFEHTRNERLLRDHERELLLQRDRLRTLDQINGVIREIIQRLPRATTHEEIGEIVCRCLVGSELYRSARIVETDAGTPVRTLADGGDGEAARSSDRWTDLPEPSSNAVTVAVETREIQLTRQYSVTQNDPEADTERTTFEAVLTVPISRGRHVEDVLVVTTDRPDAFSEPERAEFELLGEMVGFVLSSLATKNLLISDTHLELDFEVAAGDDVFVELSERADCICTVEESVPLRGGRLLQYATVEGTSPERAYEFVSRRKDVEARRLLDARDESGLLELVVSGSPIHDLIDLGANVRSIVATHGTGRITVEAPSDVDVRTLVDVLRTHYERVELVAKQERPRHVETSTRFVDVVDGRLTDRQRTVVTVAYAAGYYDWPRKSTAEEVAASLDITSATLHQHLRKAEDKLLQAYLTEHDGD